MDFKWKVNGSNLVVHNKKTGEIFLIDKNLIKKFEERIDEGINNFLKRK